MKDRKNVLSVIDGLQTKPKRVYSDVSQIVSPFYWYSSSKIHLKRLQTASKVVLKLKTRQKSQNNSFRSKSADKSSEKAISETSVSALAPENSPYLL